jgi:tetratricopeptide (TPR) repeat protein
MRATSLLGGLVLLAGLLGPILQEGASAADGARALLERASELKGHLTEVRGREREALRRRVVETYRAVRERFPAQSAEIAEAAFRAGELLRSSGEVREAREEFELARAVGTGTPFRARAGLELGHLARRAELFEDALAHYRGVLGDAQSPAAQRDQASLWAGRTCVELGPAKEARELFRRAAEQALDPCDRVEAYDALASGLDRRGRLERRRRARARSRSPARGRARGDSDRRAGALGVAQHARSRALEARHRAAQLGLWIER